MEVRVIEAPEPILTAAQIRAHLRGMERTGDVAYDDAVDADLLLKGAAAQEAIDGPSGWLGRSIGLQTLEARLSGSYGLRYGPVQSIEEVAVMDGGLGVALDPTTFSVIQDDQLFTADRFPLGDLVVRYRAGYVADKVPAPIKAALLMMVSDLNENRDAKTAAQLVDNPTVARLLAPFRSWK